jgi:hypothetical protein
MKAEIACTLCYVKLAEISRPHISEQDMAEYHTMFLCDCGHTEVTVNVTQQEK